MYLFFSPLPRGIQLLDRMSLGDFSLSLHLLGFVTGIVLYAMLAVMAWQQRSAGIGARQHLFLNDPSPARYTSRLLVIATLGLGLSIAANVLHLRTTGGVAPTVSQTATWVIMAGYALLMGLIALHLWGVAAPQRALAAAALVVFAISAAHLLLYRTEGESFGVELIVHYAPLPLVAALLYQEYRFALADVFLKRAITLITLVGIASVLYSVASTTHIPSLVLFCWIATALLYPWLRHVVYQGVDRIILRRVTVRETRALLSRSIESADTPTVVLDRACAALRTALTARKVGWREATTDLPAALPALPSIASVTIPVTEAPMYVIDVGPLAGGRRLLSEDTDLLEAIAFDVARRIDTLRINAERYERTTRETEALRLAAEAELKALHAQLNPHFLFNALTTVGYLIQTAPDRALTTLLRLTDLLRAVLRPNAGELVTVREEIAMVEAYLAIERERFEERLTTTIDIAAGVDHWRVPPLVIQPLVENAIKHGITPMTAGGTVTVTARAIRTDDDRDALLIHVNDTGAGSSPTALARGRHTGVGLGNIERRIHQYYGEDASLTITSRPGVGTTVELILPEHAV